MVDYCMHELEFLWMASYILRYEKRLFDIQLYVAIIGCWPMISVAKYNLKHSYIATVAILYIQAAL